MADDQQPDDAELASAYLDGEATPDERARVEADPILLAEVERLRAAAAAVAAVDAPSVEQREAAVGAALATFDELRVTAAEPEPPTPPANVASLDRRRQARVMQALTAVAAVAVLVIGGFVVANREGPDDSAGDIRQAPATASGEGTAPATMAMVAAPTTTAPAESAADAAETADAADAALELEDAPLAAAPPDSTSAPAAPAAAEAAATDAPPVVRDAAELRAYAQARGDELLSLAAVIAACDAETDGAAPDALFEDADGLITEIAVGATADGYAAVSLGDCSIVLRASL